MKISLSHLRKLIREELIKGNFVDILNKYIRDSRTVSSLDKEYLASEISKMRLSPGLVLERVSSNIPGNVGDVVHFDVVSFTKVRISSGENAGHIGWKSGDKCLMRVENPRGGLEVDYKLIKQEFPAFEEQEVLLTGDYRIVSMEMITEPGTKPQYGYKIPIFILKEE